MIKRVRKNLEYLGVQKGSCVGVAVSGGVDSMVLLDCLCNLHDELNIIIKVYHLEHGVRGQHSVDDMHFVQSACEQLGVECITRQVDVLSFAQNNSVSVEMAARTLRYEFLAAQNADYIATAHHMDDVAETVIMNLVRGSGLAGLCGIPAVRGRYIRPMLDISRSEIEAYAKNNGIKYVTDETNADTVHTRNFIRKQIMPNLSQINENAAANIARTAALLSEDDEALMYQAQSADCIVEKKDGVFIDIAKLLAQPAAIKKRIIREAISTRYDLKDVERVHVQSILALAEKGQCAKRVDIGRDVFVAIVYDQLMIGKTASKEYNNALVSFWGAGGYQVGGLTLVCTVCEGVPTYKKGAEYFDAHVVDGAVFRSRQQGDTICPLGLGGTKRLSDYLSDRKVPLYKRDDLIVLAKGSDVFWVVGIGVSDTSKINKTSRVYKITWEKRDAQ